MPPTTPTAEQQIRTLVTIGYEGRTLDAFVAELREAGIDVLVDVRELPLSRKPGFSKTPLRAALAAAGIDYLHLHPLGSPRAARRKLHDDGDYPAFFAAYADHLDGQDTAIRQVLALVETARVCVMCFEADAARCHRSVLASRLEGASEPDVEIVHQ